jgi:hypothetical protein
VVERSAPSPERTTTVSPASVAVLSRSASMAEASTFKMSALDRPEEAGAGYKT